MNRQIRQIRLLLGLLAVFGLCAALLGFFAGGQEEPAQEETLYVTNYKVGELQAVVLKNETGSIGLLNTASGVYVDGEDTAAYSQQKLKYLVYSLAHLTAERMVEPGTADELGLEQPAALVSLLLENETVRLRLGRQNSLTRQYYLDNPDGGQEGVYLVDEEIGALLLGSMQDLRELSPYPPITGQMLEGLEKISITNENGIILLGRQDRADTASVFYSMLAPVEADLNWELVDQYILNPIRQLQPQRFVSDDRPLAGYGLDRPQCVLELTLQNRVYRCGFVQKSPDTWYCANLEGTLVSEVPAEALPFASIDYLDLIGSSIFTKSVADLSHIGVKYKEGQFEIQISGEGDALSAAVGSRQMDAQETVAFYRQISSIPAAGRLQGAEEIDPDAILTLTMTARDGAETILEFHPISQRQCAVFVNGAADFTTYTTRVTGIIATLEQQAQPE